MTWGVGGVTVRFGNHVALDDVSLEAASGEVIGVVGGDGGGKTTLLRCLAGALAPDTGTVRRPDSHRIGYMASTSGTYTDLTVEENLTFAATAYGVPPATARDRVAEYLDRTGLSDARDRLAGQLSGGMRQKLGVVRAMMHEPDLLILDEPTTGVDPVSRADLWWLIARAAARGAAVVLTTAYLDEAERAARLLVLDGGRPLAAGTADEIIAAEQGAADLQDAVTAAALRREGTERPSPERASSRAVGRQGVLAQCRGVSRRFGAFVAVDHVDLDVHAGEVVGLLGANGAGKTTLIRMLLGLLAASDGDVRLFDEPPSRQTRRRLGYVPQGLGLYEDLTPVENLTFAAAAFGISTGVLPASLDQFADVPIGRLPLGVQRRVAFAQALSHHPDLLILDEPTSGVDPLARARLWQTIRQAAQDGSGVLVTTHHMDEAEECDRLVVMADGRVVAEGTVAEIVGDARVSVVRTDRWDDDFRALEAAGLPAALVGRTLRVPGADVDAVRRALDDPAADITEAPATLEERFLELSRP